MRYDRHVAHACLCNCMMFPSNRWPTNEWRKQKDSIRPKGDFFTLHRMATAERRRKNEYIRILIASMCVCMRVVVVTIIYFHVSRLQWATMRITRQEMEIQTDDKNHGSNIKINLWGIKNQFPISPNLLDCEASSLCDVIWLFNVTTQFGPIAHRALSLSLSSACGLCTSVCMWPTKTS